LFSDLLGCNTKDLSSLRLGVSALKSLKSPCIFAYAVKTF